jgi:NAD(P)-dependent dehydrogenase (short-subunit alcohol dehydrogenase family)
MTMYKVEGRTAVITGAGSGIGRAVAVSLGKRGCHLALSDVNERGLAETVRLVKEARGGLTVSEQRLDVADRAAVAAYPERVAAQHSSGVDVLINNAGVAVGGLFDQVSEEDFEWLFNINFFGVVRMTRAFLPMLRARDEARIVNVSSVFGLIAPPGQAAYAASKFAVRGFSESLRHELAGSNVGVSVVHPGGIATSIADSARVPANLTTEEVAQKRVEFNKHLKLPPEIAGETIVRGIENRKARILVGNDAYAIVALERVAPLSYWKLISRAISTPEENLAKERQSIR